ncbi:NAD(P)(+) transhydrogenase (Re/Si-specific) subunit beta [Paraburkholderia sp. IW21]|uniref:NAD(P)(+) transhydrogenase (Re/Si-specific) subunit beta n=1 Tax=Paraburkholderia sp. IW21 TaxID=3242488 RepID=UPI003520FDFA
MTRRPQLVALLGSGIGLTAMSGGFARYLSSTAQAHVERIELYATVFIGALIFATSTIAFCKLRGALALNAAARPGHGIVNLLALLLCGWLGYGFVTEQAQPFGFAALLAMSALAAALGAHLMVSRDYSRDHDAHAHAFAGRCHGSTVARQGLLARVEWHGGEDQTWALREIAPDMARTAAYRYHRSPNNSDGMKRRKRVSARHRFAHRAMRP